MEDVGADDIVGSGLDSKEPIRPTTPLTRRIITSSTTEHTLERIRPGVVSTSTIIGAYHREKSRGGRL
jgi:hypothetical protein